MIAYFDTSAVIGAVLSRKGVPSDMGDTMWEAAYSSALLQVEAFRAIDQLRLQGRLNDDEIPIIVQRLQTILNPIGEVPLSETVLARASQPFPVIVKALDAIHLASAVLTKERHRKDMAFVTRDIKQGLAARAMGLTSVGFE